MMAVGGRALERTAKGAKERQQLGDRVQGALSEKGELQMLCGRFLTQPMQCLEKQTIIIRVRCGHFTTENLNDYDFWTLYINL